MSDAVQAGETACFLALKAGITGATVWQHPTENAARPLVVVGDIDEAQPIGTAGDIDRVCMLQIAVETEGRQKAPCTALAAQVAALLDDQTLTQPDFTVRPTLEGLSVNMSDDGKGYVGIVTFRVFVLAD